MIARRVLAVDIGGTTIKMGAVSVEATPRLIARRSLSDHARRDPLDILPEVARSLQELQREAGWAEVEGVGVASAGLIRRDRGEIAFSPNLPAWRGAPLKEVLAHELGLPIQVDNDVNAFALAEWFWGAGGHSREAVFLTLGTGIGGAFVVEGRLVRGADGFAGEPGHATLDLDGIPCPCGNAGCAERYVGARDLVKAARKHPGFDQDPRLSGHANLTPEALAEAGHAGSRVAGEVWEHAGRALGGLLVTVVNFFNPERVVIGGGVAEAGSLLLNPARAMLATHSLVARCAPPQVLPAALGPEAGILGAAALLLNPGALLEIDP